MHFVIDQVVKLEVMHVANSNRAFKRITRTAVVKRGLRLGRRKLQTLSFIIRECKVEHHTDLLFVCTVEHWRCERHTVLQIASHTHEFFIAEAVEIFMLAGAVVDLIQEGANLTRSFRLEHLLNAPAKTLCCPAQMHFKYLTDVHTRRHTERVQHNIAMYGISSTGQIFETTPLLP